MGRRRSYGSFAALLLAAVAGLCCVTDPTQSNCAAYLYPDSSIRADIDNLCKSMPFMTACSVYNNCNAAEDQSSVSQNPELVCDPFQLLVTICKLDGMGGMSGCVNYNSMCGNNATQVAQCQKTGLVFLPTTKQSNTQVKSICNEMTMDGCEQCTPSWDAGKIYAACDLLGVYGLLCYQMPDMQQCTEWHKMCNTDPTMYTCTGKSNPSDSPAPSMIMYFNSQLPFYLLFKSWTPDTTGYYVGSWFAIFFLGVLYEALQVLRHRFEQYLLAKQEFSNNSAKLGDNAWHFPVAHNAFRALFQFISVGVAYLLMLAAMSFNVGIFFAVVGGIAFGTFLFGHMRPLYEGDAACCTA